MNQLKIYENNYGEIEDKFELFQIAFWMKVLELIYLVYDSSHTHKTSFIKYFGRWQEKQGERQVR